MRQPYHKPQHEVFIRAMLTHGDKTKAYKQAYPKATHTAARRAANRLLTYPHIQARLLPAIYDAQQVAIRQLQTHAGQRLSEELVTVYEQRRLLAEIIRGNIKLQRAVTLTNRVVHVQQDIDAAVILRAIELDCKLEAGYQWATPATQCTRRLEKLNNYLTGSNLQGIGVVGQIGTISPAKPIPVSPVSVSPKPCL